ncbi:unnamed protein product [Staurois parvus]|uniref:Uncharacterized protein n=1 Tax=Staurois parvus TaxID=386267 RepID=A0ABN9CUD4_9NEOB|nr:unnamed protein product [Staurois parvus]
MLCGNLGCSAVTLRCSAVILRCSAVTLRYSAVTCYALRELSGCNTWSLDG